MHPGSLDAVGRSPPIAPPTPLEVQQLLAQLQGQPAPLQQAHQLLGSAPLAVRQVRCSVTRTASSTCAWQQACGIASCLHPAGALQGHLSSCSLCSDMHGWQRNESATVPTPARRSACRLRSGMLHGIIMLACHCCCSFTASRGLLQPAQRCNCRADEETTLSPQRLFRKQQLLMLT